MQNNLLVSIVVVTYNSSKTIIDTLQSIYHQTYKNIELIVSDDCSEDDTIKLVNDWMLEHKGRFKNYKILTIENNTGTVKNLNRGIKATTGQWIKSIAGDDILLKRAIEEYVKFIKFHKNCKMCISGVKVFTTENLDTEKLSNEYKKYLDLTDIPIEKQQRQIAEKMLFPGPTYFYSKELYDSIGGFDENYVLSEEWSFCSNVLNSNTRIYVIHKPLIGYRITSASVCKNSRHKFGHPLWVIDNRSFFINVRRKEMLKRKLYLSVYMQTLEYTKQYLYVKNGPTVISKISMFFLDFVNPSSYRFLKKWVQSLVKITK